VNPSRRLHKTQRGSRFLESVPFESYSDDFVFDTEILVDAVVSGFGIQQVAVPTRYTKECSSINVRRSLQYIAQSVGVCAAGRRMHAGQASTQLSA
jgi:hypothetical protein